MTVLGIDTATAATAAAVWAEDVAVERRDDPAPGARPAHASRLLELIEAVLDETGGWDAVTRIAVGLGPGGFTGLRHGIATARALAQARELPLAGVSSLSALAAGTDAPLTVAVIDARRGEVFAAAYAHGETRLPPIAIPPAALAGRLTGDLAGPLAVGDGAVRFREELERAGAAVPADSSPLHRVSALQVCRLGAMGDTADRNALVPDYRREPDASPPRPPRS
jgi:tRNA threonylcarbamoyladenosine biosynthesis protein TsaB